MPLFLLQNVTLTDIKPLSGGKHTKMIVSKDGLQAQALLFGKGPLTMGYVQGDNVDLVCHVERSSYMGYTTTKLMVQKIFPTLDGDRKDKYQRQTLQEILSFESEMTDLPKRAELAVLYRFLAQAERQGQGEYSYRYVYSNLDGMTYPKLFISLLIFKEAGLINLTANENTFRFSLNAVKEKVDLEETPLYRRLRPQYD